MASRADPRLNPRVHHRFSVEEAARALSPAQRRAVMRGGISDEIPKTIRLLLARMLFYREPTLGTTCYSFRLTRFGQAVQKQLQLREIERSRHVFSDAGGLVVAA